MKLYEIPTGSRIKAETTKEDGTKAGDYIIFQHLDGAYSYCTVENTEDVVHLSASQELTLLSDGSYALN